MSEQNRELSSSIGKQADAEPTGSDLARRRRLIRLIGTGVPLVMSLPMRASAQTVNSAYRAAQYDFANPPAAMAVSEVDGWIRVKGVQYVLSADNVTPVYFINGAYFTGSGDSVEVTQVSGTGSPVYLAVLFETNFTTQSAAAIERGPWPQVTNMGQALHLSAWSSLSPGVSPGSNWFA